MMKKVLSLVMMFAVLLMPMGAIAGEIQTTEPEDTWDLQETKDSETAVQTEVDTSDEDEGGSSSLSYTLDYLFLENGEVSLGTSQTIAAHLNEDTDGIDEASLVIVSNGQEYFIPAEQIVDGYIQFTVTPDVLSDEGDYSIDRLEVSVEQETYFVDLGMEETISFEVVDSAQASVLSEKKMESAVITVEDELTSADVAEAIESLGLNDGISTMSDGEGNFVVVLDPGHDSTHTGAYNATTGITEHRANLAIALACRDELEKYKGVKVYMTHESESCAFNASSSAECLVARTNYAKSVGADLFVSFHNNAVGSGQLTSANGSEVYISGYSKYKNMSSEISKLIQTELQNNLGLNIRNFGGIVQSDGSYGYYDDGTGCDKLSVIRNSVLNGFPGILIEHAFIDNSSDAALLGNSETLKLMGISDANAIAQYFGWQVDDGADNNSPITYQVHVQTLGWQRWATEGQEAGTVGIAKRLEGIRIKVNKGDDLGVRYKTHVQTYGWQDWVSDGEMSGTTGEYKRLEAIQIELTGADADKYDVYYRVHAQTYGWLDWAKNGESAGTEGYSKRLEAIQIVLVDKGADAPGSTDLAFIQRPADINYVTHVQTYGWQDWVINGATSGTEGQSKRLEGIKILLDNTLYSGGVTYRTHVQTYGWQDWVSDGELSGTTGEYKRLEAIEIKLTGEMAEKCDIYYRVHTQTFGWLGWAKNGEPAGTAGYSKRLEGIEIIVQPKTLPAPGTTANAYYKK